MRINWRFRWRTVHFDYRQPPFTFAPLSTLDYCYIFISRYYGDSDEDRLELGRAIYQLEQCLHKCIELRKRKELEISLLQQPIRNWSGDSIEKLGTMRLMTQVWLIIYEPLLINLSDEYPCGKRSTSNVWFWIGFSFVYYSNNGNRKNVWFCSYYKSTSQ